MSAFFLSLHELKTDTSPKSPNAPEARKQTFDCIAKAVNLRFWVEGLWFTKDSGRAPHMSDK